MHRHATDIVALIAGLTFTAFAVVWALIVVDVLPLDQAFVAVPAAMVVAGLGGIAATLARPES